MIGTYVSYRNTIDNMKKTLERVQKDPTVERETAYYQENIIYAKSLDDFMADDRLYNYATKAYGLEDMSYAKGLIRKVLSDPKYAAGMTDKRFQAFAKAFDFNKYGEKTTQQDSATKVAVNRYMQQSLEEDVGNSNPGARLALYFNRTMTTLARDGKLNKDGWAYQVLADKALSEVVFTALNIPDSVRASDIDAQKKLIEKKLNVNDVVTADGGVSSQFIGRFSAMYDLNNQSQVSPALTILQSSNVGGVAGFSQNTLQAMQNLKPGGF